MSIEDIRKKTLPIFRFYGIKRAALFGSAAKGKTKETSDIDILVDIKKDISLLQFIKIKSVLEARLKKKVDLVEYDALKPAIREKVLREQVRLL